MATTTNYSWTTPDDTDLVKDGAAAIRTLGSAIDTTTKNLNPQTTTGAIAYRSATSNVNTSLAIGTAGQVLTVNSGATAPEWATPAGGGGMTLLSTTTLSGATTTITSISQSYNDLYVEIYGINFSVAAYVRVQLKNSSTAQVVNSMIAYESVFQGTSQGGTQVPLGAFANNKENLTSNGIGLQIASYTATENSRRIVKWVGIGNRTSDNQGVAFFGDGGIVGTAAIDEMTFSPNTGVFNGGTVKIWGIK